MVSRFARMLGIGAPGTARADGGGPLPAQDVEASGLALSGLPDGGLQARLERLVLRNLRLHAGVASLDVAQLALHDATLTLAPPAPRAGLELVGLAAAELRLEGLQLTLSNTAACAAPPVAGPWRLDALGGMEGLLHAFITDAAWRTDAGVTLPLRQGRLDFNRVTVEHIGPNSSMGISPAGIYIDAPHGGRTFLYLFTGGRVSGASFEQRGGLAGRVRDRGQLDLQAFVQGLLESGAPASFGRAADRHVEARLDRTRLDGELRLGDGVLGAGPQQLVLQGQAEGRNRLHLSAAVLGHKLVLHMPQLAASGAAFELPRLRGRSGPVSACVEIEASDLRDGTTLRIEVDELGLRDLVLDAGEPGAVPQD